MVIKEITIDEFKTFHKNYNMKSIYQTTEYGLVMNNQKFESVFIGLMDETNHILGASLILIEKRRNFKYAYAPRGFLIDYNDFNLVEIFTKELKKFLGKKNVIAIKISPMIVRNIFDLKYHVTNQNNYYDAIYNHLNKLGYYHLGYNYYFEAIKPRFEAIIDLDVPYYLLFKNIRKEFRTKIRSAEERGIKVYKGNDKNLEYLYLQTKNNYPRDLNYFKDCYKFFKKDNQVEFFYTKLDTAKYLKNLNKKYQTQEKFCNQLNKLLNKNDNDNIINKKIKADNLLNEYKQKLIKATKLLRDYPDGIITSSALIIKNEDEVHMIMDGYDCKYKNFNSKHLLIWKLIERYSNLGFKKFNLGGITDPNIENNSYKGLNDFKLGFNAKAVEYVGDLEIITNNTLYFMYKNTIPIRSILKK